jgi:hypothetical protein
MHSFSGSRSTREPPTIASVPSSKRTPGLARAVDWNAKEGSAMSTGRAGRGRLAQVIASRGGLASLDLSRCDGGDAAFRAGAQPALGGGCGAAFRSPELSGARSSLPAECYETDYLLPHREAAWALLEERLRDAVAFCRRLQGDAGEPLATMLGPIAEALGEIADSLAPTSASGAR